MLKEATKTFLGQFPNGVPSDDLTTILDASKSVDIEQGVADATSDTRDAAAKGAAFEGVTAKDRARLYLILIITLALLAVGGIIGGAVALVNKVDSAAFFTVAGLAIGGITGLYAPSPTGK